MLRLDGVESVENQYRWRWFDTSSPGHYNESEVNGKVTEMSFAITYPSSEVQRGLNETLHTYLVSK